MFASFPAVGKHHYRNLLSYKTKQIIGCYFWNDILIWIREKSTTLLFEKAMMAMMSIFCMLPLFGILFFCPETSEFIVFDTLM